ncbi:MAG: N-acetyltransferase family protein [Ruthenibacterium lactatiformans]
MCGKSAQKATSDVWPRGAAHHGGARTAISPAGGERPDALMLVAQEADEIVALCGLLRPRRPRMSHRAQIDASVRKSHWNHGIATRMLTELLETGVRAGVTAFTLEVRADNAAAVHVYEKLGFRTVGRLERFFRINGQYHAALLMELDA